MNDVTITVRSLHSRVERDAAVELYRATFGLSATDPAMTPKLIAALQHNGGSAVGAFGADGELVGFAYGFLGADPANGAGLPYHYSQAAVVAAGQQGKGIGRRLKLAQAEIARATGVPTMRWAYDPMLARNAHFNLDVLGARGRWFHRDYYDQDDAAGRTDRVVVEWKLTGAPDDGSDEQVRPIGAVDLDGVTHGALIRLDAGYAGLVIPADWAALARTEPERAAALRDRIADRLEELLPAGGVLVGCRKVDETRAAYVISTPWAGADEPA